MAKYRCAEDERIDFWQQKIKEGDPFYLAKENAIECAVDLRYSDTTIENIIDAKSDYEITLALQSARETQMKILMRKEMKKYA